MRVLELGKRELEGGAAARRAIGAADCQPLSDQRFAPAIKRLRRTVDRASKLARPPAADPQPRWGKGRQLNADNEMDMMPA